MATGPATAPLTLMRDRAQDGGKVGMVELFFDLVFVFAVTQLSHTLVADMSPTTALQVSLMLVAVWWVWIYTSWVTNWLDPERLQVRGGLFVLMLAGLVLAASIPLAFGSRGRAFALAYVFMQVSRTLFMLWALPAGRADLRRNFQRVLVWLTLSGVCWLIGGWAEPPARLGWWALALGLEIISPSLYFWVPGMGRSDIRDWDVDGNHLAERCGLFIIIALGESLLVSGATFAQQAWSGISAAAFFVSFVGAVAMWWLYFNKGAEAAHHRIAHASRPGDQARSAYTYLHLPIVAGIIVSAVADELVLAHPLHADNAGIAVIVGGPALYLLGTALFKWVTNARRLPPLSHLVGLALLALLAVPAFMHLLSALALSALCVAVLLLAAVWEHQALAAR